MREDQRPLSKRRSKGARVVRVGDTRPRPAPLPNTEYRVLSLASSYRIFPQPGLGASCARYQEATTRRDTTSWHAHMHVRVDGDAEVRFSPTTALASAMSPRRQSLGSRTPTESHSLENGTGEPAIGSAHWWAIETTAPGVRSEPVRQDASARPMSTRGSSEYVGKALSSPVTDARGCARD